MFVLISACLLGVACRYDGQSHPLSPIPTSNECVTFIPVCPEQLGGLPTPRLPAEICGNAVIRQDGADITDAYTRGAAEALRIAKLYGCRYAVLKERSPSCGSGTIYDGSFSKTLIDGDGVTAKLLQQNGITVIGESALNDFLRTCATCSPTETEKII
ncbi:MAG: DUF523 domain-containing protein [Ruminococcaceae bacterium]|nr:DUF523 domain-containing protein [Oscillospiraceae bacterium]